MHKKPKSKASVTVEQKPSVGRIVHYQNTEDGPPFAAIITAVFQQSMLGTASETQGSETWRLTGEVNLSAFSPNGERDHFFRVKFSETPKAGCWNWPPRN